MANARSASPGRGLVHFSETSDPRGVEAPLPASDAIQLPALALRLAGMRRRVKAAARAIQEVVLAGAPNARPWMLTLTYRDVGAWRRRDVSELLHCLRQWGARRGFVVPYVWVAELQRRGAVHYHIVVWLPKGVTLPKPDKQGWWRHGMTNVERAKRAVGYLLKYATKGGDDDGLRFPRGLRLCGSGGHTGESRAVRYWLTLPEWVIRKARSFQRVVRLPGGLWVSEQTGEVWRSAWEFVKFDGGTGMLHFRRRSSEPPLPLPNQRCCASADAAH